MLYDQTASRVDVLPGVQTEHMAVCDDQRVPGGDEALDFLACEDTAFALALFHHLGGDVDWWLMHERVYANMLQDTDQASSEGKQQRIEEESALAYVSSIFAASAFRALLGLLIHRRVYGVFGPVNLVERGNEGL